LAFGYGLTGSIADAYSFLMDTFEPGDHLFLFGFSRGAYIVRALSGMLHMFGLIRPKEYNLIGYATEMLKQKQDANSFRVAADFKRTFSRECKPYFTGVYDTVSSVGWVWDPVHVPYTARDPDLSIGRHALAIDERRCFFRQNLWSRPIPTQDIKQVWFAGVHSDIGGGYAESESGLAKIALEWMLCEASKAGLLVDGQRAATVLGYAGGHYAVPNEAAVMHNSLTSVWTLLEPLPHRYVDMSVSPPKTKIKFPFGRRRQIPEGAAVHESVEKRMAFDPGYRPPNLPAARTVEPWIKWHACERAE
jgi:uncharacterized protein (DUF2235 family)